MVRYYGIGPDISTINDAWLALSNTETETITGTVTAPNGVVPGARVNVLVEEQPYVLAITDAKGAFSAQVPKGSVVTTLAEGRGEGIHANIPPGHGQYSPYANQQVQTSALNSIASGATQDILSASGRGVAKSDNPLMLHDASTLTVRSKDGLPFEVRLLSIDGEESVDDELVQGRPAGYDHGLGGGNRWHEDGADARHPGTG